MAVCSPIMVEGGGFIRNGHFDSYDYWERTYPWYISGGKAWALTNYSGRDYFLNQFTSLELGKTYTLTFDVYNADFPGDSNLFARLGGVGGSRTPAITTNGSKSFDLEYIGFGQYLSFVLDNLYDWPAFVEIDNAKLGFNESFPAVALNLMNYDDGYVLPDQVGPELYNIKYACRRDGSNVLVAFDTSYY